MIEEMDLQVFLKEKPNGKTMKIKSNGEEFFIFVDNEKDLLNLVVPQTHIKSQNEDSTKDKA